MRAYVFAQERGDRLSAGAFWKIVKRAGEVAGFAFPVHPHMLRHACGYRLTNDGTDTHKETRDSAMPAELRHQLDELERGAKTNRMPDETPRLSGC